MRIFISLYLISTSLAVLVTSLKAFLNSPVVGVIGMFHHEQEQSIWFFFCYDIAFCHEWQ